MVRKYWEACFIFKKLGLAAINSAAQTPSKLVLEVEIEQNYLGSYLFVLSAT